MNGPFMIPVSNKRAPERMWPVRSPQQRQTVREIVARDDFDFACGNPFPQDMGGYIGPFSFLFYDTDGKLHSVRIAKSGRILREILA